MSGTIGEPSRPGAMRIWTAPRHLAAFLYSHVPTSTDPILGDTRSGAEGQTKRKFAELERDIA